MELERTMRVDDLAQEIRRIDGENSLGAGALAEALMPFIAAGAVPVLPSGVREILAPCPFCSGTQHLALMPGKDLEGDDWGFHVICDASGFAGERGCGAAGGWGETEADAVEAWSRRAQPASRTPGEGAQDPLVTLQLDGCKAAAEAAAEAFGKADPGLGEYARIQLAIAAYLRAAFDPTA